jgi:pimeloyl-ACP methyl ester carboxylesterase
MATPTKRPLRIPRPGGGQVEGDVRSGGDGRPAVVLCGPFPHLADRLARAGLTAVSFTPKPGQAGDDDLAIVLDALHEGAAGAAPSSVAVFGHDQGAAAALRRAVADPEIRALVTWAARADDSETAARVEVPWLIVHGTDDAAVPADAARELHHATRGRAELFLFPGDALDHAFQAAVSWFANHLR